MRHVLPLFATEESPLGAGFQWTDKVRMWTLLALAYADGGIPAGTIF